MDEKRANQETISVIIDTLRVTQEKVVPKALLVEDLGADSLDQIELIMAIEDHFDIDIPDSDVERIKTVEDILKYVSAKV
jgi:acyl carrier protein